MQKQTHEYIQEYENTLEQISYDLIPSIEERSRIATEIMKLKRMDMQNDIQKDGLYTVQENL